MIFHDPSRSQGIASIIQRYFFFIQGHPWDRGENITLLNVILENPTEMYVWFASDAVMWARKTVKMYQKVSQFKGNESIYIFGK